MRRCFAAGVAILCGASVPASAMAQSPAAAPTSIAVGDWQLSPQLELRTRGEYRRDAPQLAGAFTPGYASGITTSIAPAPARDAYGVLERTRVGLGAEYGAVRGDPGFLRAQVTIQDARAWGIPNPTGILGAEGSGPASIGVYEAWVEARTSSARPAYLRVGRQAITWGDGRLVSNADWSPVARTLDAVRGHASLGLFDFELFAAILDTPTPLGPAFGQTTTAVSSGTELYGAQIAASFAPLLKLELSALAREAQSAAATPFGETETYVGSLRVFGDARSWRYAVEGAYEHGRKPNFPQNVWAGAVAGYVERKLDGVVLAPALRLEADYASGPTSNGNGYFDPILPDVHELHGAMDLFAWSNTVEVSARATMSPWAEGRLAVEYRYARLASSGGNWVDAYLNTTGYTGLQELGHEVDAWASWRPWPVLELTGGYSIFVAGAGALDALKITEGGAASLSHFAYLQATLRVP